MIVEFKGTTPVVAGAFRLQGTWRKTYTKAADLAADLELFQRGNGAQAVTLSIANGILVAAPVLVPATRAAEIRALQGRAPDGAQGRRA